MLAFVAMPGMVAFVLPATWIWREARHELVHPVGIVLLALGVIGLFWCVRDFYVIGKGTLAPWAPPKRLVAVGLYRRSRNPMYVSVLLVLAGWAAAFGSLPLVLYAAFIGVAFELRVVLGEEPWLARTHGGDWEEYARRVPRWF